MKIRKFLADSMPEAMQMIRKSLGKNAVILNSRKVKSNGFLGFFRKTKIEVVAAIDDEIVERKQKLTQPVRKKEKNLKKDSFADESILEELQELKKMIYHQTEQAENLTFHYPYSEVYEFLKKQEIDKSLIESIIEEIIEEHDKDNQSFKNALNETKYKMIKELEKISFNNDLSNKKIIHFVGPTGVGKTTTLAKIAAKYSLTYNQKIAFITTDTYRIAAVDQLRTYAKILNIPLKVAYSKEDYEDALDAFSNYDLILVDTAGRNYRDKRYISELKQMIEFNKKSIVYLVLSLTAKREDLIDIYNQFENIPVESFIFTKIDETKSFGSLFNLPIVYKKGIAYLTNGQDVPDDLTKTNTKDIIELIFNERTSS